MNRRMKDRSYQTIDRKFVIHLYRSYKLPITFSSKSATLSGRMQHDLIRVIQAHQVDFLSKISQLRHNYTNYLRLIEQSDEKTNARGIFRQSVGWYGDRKPEYYERFKQLLLDIRNLLPSLSESVVDLPDDEVMEKIRRFETEANSVIVSPVRDMGFKVLTRTLVGEGLLTEQAMNVYFNLKDSDFDKKSFSRIIARVISNRNRLYFRKNIVGDLLAANINVLQGQLDGHCSHLMSILTSRDMGRFVQSSLRGIRRSFLPVIMAQVIKDLSDLDRYRGEIYSHTMFKEKISLKDLVLHNTTHTPGYLAECLEAIGPLTTLFDPSTPDNENADIVSLRTVQTVERALDRLNQFGMGIRRLPEKELDLKIKWLRDQFVAGVDACLELLSNYDGIFEKVNEAVQPLMGLISFDSGGQSDFYTRWFPGLNDMLRRDSLVKDYILTLKHLKTEMENHNDEEEELKGVLSSWISPEIVDHLRQESHHIRNFVSGDLCSVLSWSYVFLKFLDRFPEWFFELEDRIFADIDNKKGFARQVIAAGKG